MLISSHVGKIQNYRKFRWICVLPITALAYMLFSYTAVAGTSSSVYECGTVIYANPGFFQGVTKLVGAGLGTHVAVNHMVTIPPQV